MQERCLSCRGERRRGTLRPPRRASRDELITLRGVNARPGLVRTNAFNFRGKFYLFIIFLRFAIPLPPPATSKQSKATLDELNALRRLSFFFFYFFTPFVNELPSVSELFFCVCVCVYVPLLAHLCFGGRTKTAFWPHISSFKPL